MKRMIQMEGARRGYKEKKIVKERAPFSETSCCFLHPLAEKVPPIYLEPKMNFETECWILEIYLRAIAGHAVRQPNYGNQNEMWSSRKAAPVAIAIDLGL